jgi:hypothetical protein
MLLEITDLNARVALVEDYLWNRLSVTEKKHTKIKFIGDIVHNLKKNYSEDNIISYLQSS